MNSIILLGAMTTFLGSTGNVGMGDDISFNGSGSYINETTFRMTSSAFSEEEYKWFGDYRQLNVNQWFAVHELYIDDSENYFGITQELYVSTNNQDYELVGVASNVLVADMSMSNVNANMYADLVMSINTGDYFASCYDMIGKYFKIKTTFSYENIHTDTDLSWNTYENTQRNSIAGLTISKYTPSYEEALKDGYESGYANGQEVGYNSGYTNGYNKGYQDGYDYTENLDDYSVQSMLTTILDYPLKLVKQVTNVELFGVNLYSVITFVISISLVAFVIKYFI